MSSLQVKFKKLHPDAVLPKYAKPGDAGLDMVAVSKQIDEVSDLISYETGLAMEIPEGYVGLIFPRSSICKYDLLLSNHVGVIDSGYRGSITFKFRPTPTDGVPQYYNVGDKIGQLVIIPCPKIQPEFTEELSSTERGFGAYGSTGV